MPPKSRGPYTAGSPTFSPSALLSSPEALTQAITHLLPSPTHPHGSLHSAISSYFAIPPSETYLYHALISVNLSQVQSAIDAGAANGLHDWYRDPSSGKPLSPPPAADIDAYTSIFDPRRSAANTLKAFAANAKKGSLRSAVAKNLSEKRYVHASVPAIKASKKGSDGHLNLNPAYEFWAWSCRALEWCGPEEGTAEVKASHHVLPVFMHHFGCVVPSWEGLEVLKWVVERGRGEGGKGEGGKKGAVLDVCSGGGYWTLMLRRHFEERGCGAEVIAVDSGQSVYRTVWIGDTVVADGVKYIEKDRGGGKGDVLLLVYPIVGGERFTERVVRAFKGDWAVVAGTQCKNGYTAFKDVIMDEWMESEGCWEKMVQLPLPSFAGKDEALFVFKRVEGDGVDGG